jgi:hypothetical protein
MNVDGHSKCSCLSQMVSVSVSNFKKETIQMNEINGGLTLWSIISLIVKKLQNCSPVQLADFRARTSPEYRDLLLLRRRRSPWLAPIRGSSGSACSASTRPSWRRSCAERRRRSNNVGAATDCRSAARTEIQNRKNCCFPYLTSE